MAECITVSNRISVFENISLVIMLSREFNSPLNQYLTYILEYQHTKRLEHRYGHYFETVHPLILIQMLEDQHFTAQFPASIFPV